MDGIIQEFVKNDIYPHLNEYKNEEEIMKHYVRDIPLQRPNNPEDIASMVVFLSSKGARNISGQSYNVDGGLIPS